MFTTHLIQPAEHAAWWQRVRHSPDHRVLVLNCQGQDCGVVTFTRAAAGVGDDGATWDWGFYLGPDSFAQPLDQLRAWSAMERESLSWAATPLQARHLHCEVLAGNAAVLALHRRHGFIERGRYWRERDGESLEVIQLGRALAAAAA